ncbi:MAG TPA: tetratricopeptide repeat-containing glycosyltransferase family protein [Tepidisphaeraceae bacterium]|nr:tetratricopeptide repeat-containing glycosyltransferase family protein [Tepidisphaeraceae bacterium]
MPEITLDQALEIAVAHHQAGRLAQAEAIYLQIIEKQSEHPDALHLLGAVKLQAGQVTEALRLIEHAIRLAPEIADFHCTYGQALGNSGEKELAIESLQRAIKLQPNYPEAFNNLGNILQSQGELEQAIGFYEQALSLRPNFAEAHNNLGDALRKQRRLSEAISHLDNAVRLRPDFADAHNNLGVALRDAGQFEQAIASYQRSIALRPDWPSPHHNLALARLLLGDLETGWPEYEWRLRVPGLAGSHRKVDGRRWNGECLDGKTLYIHCEQGLGDTIQFVRYLPLVAERGAKIVLRSQPEWVRLLEQLPCISRIISDSDAEPAFDVHCPLLSLPLIFETRIDTIPSGIPYVKAGEESSSRWRKRTSGLVHQKIGLVWTGREGHYDDQNRSMKFDQFKPILQLPDLHFFSLQKGYAKPQGETTSIIDWTDDLNDFADTAGLIQNLDLVITVDTAVAHLAGAMDKPVFVLLPFVPDWRWLLGRNDSPWYPTMRLFRQPVHYDWETPIRQIVASIDSANF